MSLICTTVTDNCFQICFLTNNLISSLSSLPDKFSRARSWKCSFSVDKQILPGNVMAKLKCPQWGKECNSTAVLSYSNKILFHTGNICCKWIVFLPVQNLIFSGSVVLATRVQWKREVQICLRRKRKQEVGKGNVWSCAGLVWGPGQHRAGT